MTSRHSKSTSRALATNALDKRIVPLDVLRVLAILMVFAFHFPKVNGVSIFGPAARYGWMGVDLFFVLSGYLIGAQIIRRTRSGKPFSFKNFYMSRFLRTLPVYFAVLIAYLLIDGFREKPTMAPLWRFLTFTQNFGLLNSAFSHAWSLCIEEQFYLVCPAIILVLSQIKHIRISIVVFISMIFAGALYRNHAWVEFHGIMTPENKWDLYLTSIYYPTWGRLDGLALGVFVASIKEVCPEIWEATSRHRGFVLLFALASFASSIYLFIDRLSWASTVFGYPILAVSFALLLVFAATEKSRLNALRAIGVGQVAILSYSFYLIHKQVIHIVGTHWSFGASYAEQAAFAVTSFALSLMLAFFMYQLIERPFLAVRDSALRGRQ